MTVARYQVRRSYDTGVTPNTTSSSNGTFIDSGELAVNFADGRLYTSNGSALLILGQNVSSLYVNTTIQIGSNATINATHYTGEASSANSINGTTVATINAAIVANASAAYTNSLSYADARAAAAYSNAIGYYTGSFVPITGGTYSGNVSVGNSTVNVTINSTSFSGSSNSALTANNAQFLGGANVATIRTEITGNSATAYANAVANAAALYQTTAGLTANVATRTANNSTYLNGQLASYYTNATNLSTGTVNTARLGSGVADSTTVLYGNNVWAAPPAINTAAQYTYTNTFTVNASFVVGSNTISVGNSSVNTVINSTAVSVNGSSLTTVAQAIAFAVAL